MARLLVLTGGRRRACMRRVACLACGILLGMGGGASTASAAAVLPDLDQSAPSGIITRHDGDKWVLAFDSTVVNVGSGNLRLLGHRPDTTVNSATTDQIIDQSGGGTTTVANVGTMRYVNDVTHQHWHLLDFEHFWLTSTSGTRRRDTKQGFCLWQLSVNDCGLDEPNLLKIPMGMAPGGADQYKAAVAGNSVDITGLAAGDYVLAQRANATGLLRETTWNNNWSSARVRLQVDKSGKYAVHVLATCPDSATCPPSPYAD